MAMHVEIKVFQKGVKNIISSKSALVPNSCNNTFASLSVIMCERRLKARLLSSCIFLLYSIRHYKIPLLCPKAIQKHI